MIRKILQHSARGDVFGNIANKFRNKRIQIFLDLIEKINQDEIRILDIGGTDYFWEYLTVLTSKDLKITLLNKEISETNPKFEYILSDACHIELINPDKYDLVFSNSVIEHVGDEKMQMQFADEIKRIAQRYFIQTPNYYFPFEPHFLFPGFHFLPIKMRAMLIRHFDLGWFDKEPDYEKSLSIVKSIRLLDKKGLKNLFPESTLIEEKFLGFTKSLIVFYGFD